MKTDRWRANRRRVLAGIGGAAAITTSAGCLGLRTDPEGGVNGSDTGAGGDESIDDDSDPVTEAAETTVTDTDPDTWVDVSTIRLDAYVGGWVGVEPDHIDRVENPTLVLVEGQEYELTCENQDNVKHNLAIHDESGAVVDGLSSPIVAALGDTETLRFEVHPEMVTYICEHQPVIQLGDILVVDG
ncbi:hypothetical protein C482_04841 [Natrialba chahannaoensis JCM 10990]|uniref:Blue (Type 1) copper domain-containing protein n=1 Tax=Natrialba chahannaoensis JCM 10990 TaxID=1227492 RepID=M0AWS3_9EURY|nr:hypothetical protein [Natrialba chahannaoensis]ELZ02955.1 hypothetical protein C482_04841 [Natrialba chahannaoensis JCM 10990]